MNKIVLRCLILIILFGISLHGFPEPACWVSFAGQKELPAPFAKIKEMALACKPDSDGDYIWEKKITHEDETVTHVILYFPDGDIVGIGKNEKGLTIIVAWVGARDAYITEAYMYGTLFGQAVLEEEEAIKQAYEFFREMIAEKLI